MKFKGLDIQHVEVIDDRLLLTCDGVTIDVGQNLGIVYQTIDLSRETRDLIKAFNQSDKCYRIAAVSEYDGKYRQRGPKIIRRQSTTLSLSINQIVIEDKKEVEKHAFTFAFSMFN